ncbi:hypothetical protein EDB81DRAFT_856812 [Dactylonectria macrodidyma]|uniref:YAG7-like dimerisation domain-containing protein n=1 Tax=Dactylonectria macrodidyma TaxID=307937 RepID=A0A9P9J7R4_9HYPO|nr:hypothetical protein EDB81DRAFT_856812 [Dactylonectria macrodidyma]
MAAPAVQPASKSSKKKAPRGIERTESPAPSFTSTSAEKAGDDSESPYIKELQKNIRNVNKKITNASKTDSLLSQHAGKSLEELVDSKIINPDQKAQILKKPALQAQLAQYEEQLVQYQKVDEQYRTRIAAEKAEWERNLEKVKADSISEAEKTSQKALKDNLLVLSQFLRLAAYRREEAKDPESDESQAIEGVLLAIYSGDDLAVQSMLNLVNGTEDQIVSVPGEQLETTFSKVRSLAQEYKTPVYPDESQPTETEAVSDPTIANATVAEIEAGDAALSSGPTPEPAHNGIANASVADDAANAVAESHWDTGNNSANNELSMSQEWVDVKAETETAAPAANTQSWADDHPEQVPEPAAAPADDGFHQVQRKPRNEGGGHRGRGRGEWRGRGSFRGEGRGRGRGNRGDRGDRGDRGAGGPNRPRRTEEQ